MVSDFGRGGTVAAGCDIPINPTSTDGATVDFVEGASDVTFKELPGFPESCSGARREEAFRACLIDCASRAGVDEGAGPSVSCGGLLAADPSCILSRTRRQYASCPSVSLSTSSGAARLLLGSTHEIHS